MALAPSLALSDRTVAHLSLAVFARQAWIEKQRIVDEVLMPYLHDPEQDDAEEGRHGAHHEVVSGQE